MSEKIKNISSSNDVSREEECSINTSENVSSAEEEIIYRAAEKILEEYRPALMELAK
jgi:hypothetical protein